MPKIWKCQFDLKFGICTNPNMQNSVVIFTFSVLDQKHPFVANLVSQFKTVFFSKWNLVPRLIGICRIQWCCSLFHFWTGNVFFWANLVQKIQNCLFKLEFFTWLIRMWRIPWWCSFLCFWWKYSFSGNIFQKINVMVWCSLFLF